MSPLEVACPACNAQPGQPCTNATDTGRRPVSWIHFARESAAGAIALTRTDKTKEGNS